MARARALWLQPWSAHAVALGQARNTSLLEVPLLRTLLPTQPQRPCDEQIREEEEVGRAALPSQWRRPASSQGTSR